MPWVALLLAAALAQQPVPQPFPRPGTAAPPRQGQPAPPQPQAAAAPQTPPPARTDGAPTEAMLGVVVYPGAQFLLSFDAGRGQRHYFFGSTASFVDLVT